MIVTIVSIVFVFPDPFLFWFYMIFSLNVGLISCYSKFTVMFKCIFHNYQLGYVGLNAKRHWLLVELYFTRTSYFESNIQSIRSHIDENLEQIKTALKTNKIKGSLTSYVRRLINNGVTDNIIVNYYGVSKK